MKKLNLGAGKDIRIGWQNIDKEQGDFLEMDFTAESIDAILLNHVAMYIRPEEMKPFLDKAYKWLKMKGTIHMETQNLKQVTDPETLFGMGKNAGHKWAWTPTALQKMMDDAGFVTNFIPGILHGKPERDFLICGIKI